MNTLPEGWMIEYFASQRGFVGHAEPFTATSVAPLAVSVFVGLPTTLSSGVPPKVHSIVGKPLHETLISLPNEVAVPTLEPVLNRSSEPVFAVVTVQLPPKLLWQLPVKVMLLMVPTSGLP